MFKELFTTANKSKGIAGMTFDQNQNADLPDDKSLNKQRSKKDLKNKFQSSASAVEFDDKENKNSIDESEVEEIIKQHLAEEEGGKKKKKKKDEKENQDLEEPDEEEDADDQKKEEDEDSDGYDYMDDSLNMNVKSPK